LDSKVGSEIEAKTMRFLKSALTSSRHKERTGKKSLMLDRLPVYPQAIGSIRDGNAKWFVRAKKLVWAERLAGA
jgi:hypothetical protein